MKWLYAYIGDVTDIQIEFNSRTEKFIVYILCKNSDITLTLTPKEFIEFYDTLLINGYADKISKIDDDIISFFGMYKSIIMSVPYIINPVRLVAVIKNEKLFDILVRLVRDYLANFDVGWDTNFGWSLDYIDLKNKVVEFCVVVHTKA